MYIKPTLFSFFQTAITPSGIITLNVGLLDIGTYSLLAGSTRPKIEKTRVPCPVQDKNTVKTQKRALNKKLQKSGVVT